jgi:hypothetical protein
MFAHLLTMYPAAAGKLRKLMSLTQVWFGETVIFYVM